MCTSEDPLTIRLYRAAESDRLARSGYCRTGVREGTQRDRKTALAKLAGALRTVRVIAMASLGSLFFASGDLGRSRTDRSGGYSLVASDVEVFNSGGAGCFGSDGNKRLSAPVVCMAATPDGGGYLTGGRDRREHAVPELLGHPVALRAVRPD